ncbi:hypothetical protein SAMN05216548_12725 [Faunimonas pinastri]|uniref:Uncharacterized protein n=1 Tax=Faunimonas pinastri TaxID=1855383 RepID=A0A1H9QED9_9HYPH|nr:hypothetical protein [Faunimonas pinastri]SER58788.1 hypothetical protein SAMN05216548_12725 [Faunimonas pinastri]
MQPDRVIQLTFCRIEVYPGDVVTHFPDGTYYGSQPHDTPEYRALAQRLGYGHDIDAYNVDHEFCHSFLPEVLNGQPSRVLWALARGRMAPRMEILHEEALAVMFQGFLRGDIIMAATAPKLNWWDVREEARGLLKGIAPMPMASRAQY